MAKSKHKKVTVAAEFLTALLEARSPSGYEFEAQAVLDTFLQPAADEYRKDALGNRIATLNPGGGGPTVLLAGHMDELGLIVRHIDDRGFIYFDTIGGHDATIISGRRVQVIGKKGTVHGVTGKRAIHLMSPEDRKKVPELHDIWVDIGAGSRAEAEKQVRIGDPIVYDHGFSVINGSIATSRAFDDKAGCYVVCETLRRLVAKKRKIAARLVAVATTQEEIGTRGATTAGFSVDPQIAVAVDVGHATDHPDCDHRKFGKFALGSGPIIARGPNINPGIFNRLVQLADKHKIPYQIEAEARPTPTDARALQMTRGGVATGLLSIPLRYMHTPSEIVDLNDIENTVNLLVEFVASLKKGDTFLW